MHEGVVMDNLQMFEMNGFLFEIDHNGVLPLKDNFLCVCMSVSTKYRIAGKFGAELILAVWRI